MGSSEIIMITSSRERVRPRHDCLFSVQLLSQLLSEVKVHLSPSLLQLKVDVLLYGQKRRRFSHSHSFLSLSGERLDEERKSKIEMRINILILSFFSLFSISLSLTLHIYPIRR